MEGKRVVIDGVHEHRRSKVFAILVIVGVIIVAAVWYSQLHTMVRSARLSELGEDFSVFEQSFQESFGNDDVTGAAATAAIQEAVRGAMGDKIIEDQAKAAVADQAAAALSATDGTTPSEQPTPESEAIVAP